MVNHDIPEGQGAVNDLLAECYELLHQLREDEDEQPDDNDSDNEDAYSASTRASSAP